MEKRRSKTTITYVNLGKQITSVLYIYVFQDSPLSAQYERIVELWMRSEKGMVVISYKHHPNSEFGSKSTRIDDEYLPYCSGERVGFS